MEPDPTAQQRGSRSVHVLRSALLACCLTGAFVALTPAQGKAPKGKCRSPTGTVLASGPLAVAYKRESTEFDEDLLIACLRSTGRKRVLATTPDWFDRPARDVAVDGSTVAYVLEEAPASDSEPQITSIKFALLRKPARADRKLGITVGVSQAQRGPPPDRPYPRVESIDITNRGAAAWIECPDQGSSECDGTAFQREQEKRVVAVADSTAPAQKIELSRSASIAPRSVRIEGKRTKRVSWVQDGRRRSARLPQRPTR